MEDDEPLTEKELEYQKQAKALTNEELRHEYLHPGDDSDWNAAISGEWDSREWLWCS